MPLKKEVITKYINPVFVETGSLRGQAIDLALLVGFSKVISVELSKKFYDFCYQKFLHDSRVKIFHGDVELMLWDMIKDIYSPITFWLDAHDSGGDTAKGIHGDPIIQELDIIKKHSIKNHTILVDDLRGMLLKDIQNKLLEINPKYSFSFEDGFIPNDILVARIL